MIITDGMENASIRYSAKQIKKKIEVLKEKFHWEFIFLAANIDTVETARHFGISAKRAQNYHADKLGTESVFDCLNVVTTNYLKSIPSAGLPDD